VGEVGRPEFAAPPQVFSTTSDLVDVPLVEETATAHSEEDDEGDKNEQLDLIRTHSIHLLSPRT
jgi:hypothetical protein